MLTLMLCVALSDGQAVPVAADNPIPAEVLAALAKADAVELLSLDPMRPMVPPKDGFHGWKVLGRTAVKDEKTHTALLTSLRKAAEASDGTAAFCFNPRHGLRVTTGKATVDLVICFECLQVRAFAGDDARPKGFLITGGPQKGFDQVLKDAGVPLAKN